MFYWFRTINTCDVTEEKTNDFSDCKYAYWMVYLDQDAMKLGVSCNKSLDEGKKKRNWVVSFSAVQSKERTNILTK